MRPPSLPRRATLALAILPLALLIALLVGVPGAPAVRAQDGPLPEGPGVQLVYAKCQQCHTLRYVTESAGLPPFLWQDTIDLMQQLGMQVTEEEEQTLYDYFVTYLGPDGPPEASAATGSDGGAPDASGSDGSEDANDGANAAAQSGEAGENGAPDVDGGAVYAANCASCHGAEGGGVAGAFPPLAGHAQALFGADRDYLPQLLLYGLQGGIEVRGESYDGVMPAWAHLGDAEIAAVLNHTLTSWGGDDALPDDAERYDAADIAAQRGLGLSAAGMLERRPALGD